MVESIKYQLSHLTDFGGRDARQTFWYYVLFLIVLQFLIGMIAAIPMYIEMFSDAMDAARSGVDTNTMEANMMVGISGSLQQQATIGAVIGLLVIGLFLAAFVRRLHDAGFSGWWAALPVALQLGAIWASFEVLDIVSEAMRTMGDDPGAMRAMQSETIGYSLLGWVGYLVVIIFGVMKSDGPNRYGQEPVRC